MPKTERQHDIRIEYLGPLYGEDMHAKEAYTGTIGVNPEKDKGAIELLRRLNWDLFFESTADGASERCVDERGSSSVVEGIIREAGPQSAGGSVPYAVIHGLVRGTTSTIFNDLDILRSDYQKYNNRFDIGGHTGSHAHFPNVGCGAVDQFPIIVVSKLANPAVQPYLKDSVQALMGPGKFSESVFHYGLDGFSYIGENLSTYLGKDKAYQTRLMDMIKQDADNSEAAIEEQAGSHQALAVIANYVEDTTLSRDMLAMTAHKKTGRSLQAFGFDAWYPSERSERLYPGEDQMQSLATTMTYAYNVATLMTLTDGSIDLLTRSA